MLSLDSLFLFLFLLACRSRSPAERRYLSMLMSSLTWKEGTSGRPAEAARVPPPPAAAARGIELFLSTKGKSKILFF